MTVLLRAATALLLCAGHAMAAPWFTDATEEYGLDFAHVNGFSPERRLVETMGSGGALLDYDRDGDLDLYMTQGNTLPVLDRNTTDRLYRQDDGRFTDVTEASGLGSTAYGMGAVAADFDGDGYEDLYVTNLGANILYRNAGDGRFEDVTASAGVGCDLLSTSAAFADYDNDGDFDLYVCNYVEYSVETDVPCYFGGLRIYCGPNEYVGIADVLYRNDGDGTFTDVTREAGVYEPDTRGLGVVFADIDDDGWLDIYVANDMTQNLLFVNQRDGTFAEEGVLRGVAFNGDGIANGSMGVDAADYDNDGDIDLWMTNFSLEANCLLANDGEYFYDATFDVGVAEPSFLALGFGTRFVDVDNDGWTDILVGNGHIWDNVDEIDDTLSYEQPVQLFENMRGSFVDATARSGLGQAEHVVRGMVFGDLDNDGDTDVVLCRSNSSAVVLRNEVGQVSNWVGLDLVTPTGAPAIGARATVTAGGMTQTREVTAGASYLSGSDRRLVFGLGD
ncbi:CRTAC1 family protein, partial [Candidatus Poribacteria bacterium]|nr:CRTAC1 family protein [Candidatus Poribacteria bacterium]